MAVTTPTIRWSNGHVENAPTWEILEAKVCEAQWWEYEPEEFRAAMAKRAYRWSGVDIDITGTSEEFFAQLRGARLIEYVTDDNEREDI